MLPSGRWPFRMLRWKVSGCLEPIARLESGPQAATMVGFGKSDRPLLQGMGNLHASRKRHSSSASLTRLPRGMLRQNGTRYLFSGRLSAETPKKNTKTLAGLVALISSPAWPSMLKVKR